MKSIQLDRSIPRYVLSKALGKVFTPVYWSPLAMLRYRETTEPSLPTPQWVRVSTRYGGICGSDMNAVMLNDSPALTALVSFPFTLGHENVGVITEVGSDVKGFAPGDRVVVDPVLPCITRNISPVCEYCARGDYALCQNFAEGELSPGLSIGHCRDTGGSWSQQFVAHQSQLFHLPDQVSDENGVMIDAFCTTLHPVLAHFPNDWDQVLILGSGVVGLCTLIALRILNSQAWVSMVAKYPFQAALADRYGADEVILLKENDLYKTITSKNGGKVYQPALGKPFPVGGADIVFDCVGSANSLDDSLRLARSAGKVILIGLASIPGGVDWTPIWLNELSIHGSYWCSTEMVDGNPIRTYQMTLDWMVEGKLDLSEMVTHRFPLEEYQSAFKTTSERGKNHVVKSVFEFNPLK